MSSSNLVQVTSPEHFQELLSADLNRVSVLNFWASWAEPCEEFNKVIEEEAKQFEKLLFLNVSRVPSPLKNTLLLCRIVYWTLTHV